MENSWPGPCLVDQSILSHGDRNEVLYTAFINVINKLYQFFKMIYESHVPDTCKYWLSEETQGKPDVVLIALHKFFLNNDVYVT